LLRWLLLLLLLDVASADAPTPPQRPCTTVATV
jgi:hypothetical protein